MTAPEGHGVGFAGEDGESLGAYAHAVPNPDGKAWTLEIANGAEEPEAYDTFLSAVLDGLVEVGAADVVLWVHAQNLRPTHPEIRLERELHHLSRSLTSGGEPARPDGVEVRGFRVGEDEEAWLSVNNRAFAGHPEQSGWTNDDLALRMASGWFDPEGLRMIWVDGALAAFNWTKLYPQDSAGNVVGEIFVIAVDPTYRGRGLGRAAAIEGLRDLAQRQGAATATLYVDAANSAGRHLYRSLGFRTDHVHRAYRWKHEY